MHRFNHCRKTAIALNNLAVVMLSRGWLNRARDTLQDSIQFMKLASDAREVNTTGYVSSVYECQEAETLSIIAIHSAQERLSNGSDDDHDHDNDNNRTSKYIVKPLSNQTFAYTLLKNDDFFGLVPMPMFIDEMALDNKNDAFEFERSVILYNDGLSRTLLADDSEANMNNTTSVQLQSSLLQQQSALEEFELAKSLLCKIHYGCCWGCS
jgi:hypothetical protein